MSKQLSGLLIHMDILKVLREEISKEMRSDIIDWAIDYVLYGEIPDTTNCETEKKILFKLIQSRIDTAIANDNKRANASRENGKKGGRPRKDSIREDEQYTDQSEQDDIQSDDTTTPDDLNALSEYTIPCTDDDLTLTVGQIRMLKRCFKGTNIDVEQQIGNCIFKLSTNPTMRKPNEETFVYLKHFIGCTKETNARPTPAAQPTKETGGKKNWVL